MTKCCGEGITAMAEEVQNEQSGGAAVRRCAGHAGVHTDPRRYHALVTFREKSPVAGAGLSALQAKIVSRYIEENLDQQLRLADLANVARISVTHFLRQFKRRFGCAPHVYVIQRRLARAQRLLAKTPLSIKESRGHQRFCRSKPHGHGHFRSICAPRPPPIGT